MNATAHEHTIINRCTRDGRVAWQHVAQQLGKPVHSVRSAFDPDYMRSGPSVVSIRAIPNPAFLAPPKARPSRNTNPILPNMEAAVLGLADIGHSARAGDIMKAAKRADKAIYSGIVKAREEGMLTSAGPHQAVLHTLTVSGEAFAKSIRAKLLEAGWKS